MDTVQLVGLIAIDLPGHSVRMCDGGFLRFGGDTYRSVDAIFGTLAGIEALTEGVGDEAPAGTLTFHPATAATAKHLNDGGYQSAPLRMWIGEVDPATGQLIGEPDLMVDAMVDRTNLTIGPRSRSVEVDYVPLSERLFLLNEGNTLSSSFHRQVWPGELGFDNASGVSQTVAWGVLATRGTTFVGGGGGGGSGGGGGGGAGPINNSEQFQ